MTRTSLLVALAIAGSAAAGTIDDGRSDEEYVAAGLRYADVVVEISGKLSEGERAKASAVAIRPRWVLTAAHVLRGCSDVRVKTCSGETHEASLWVMHEDFDLDNVGVNDIALCRLRTPIMARKFPKLSDECEPGEVCDVAGVGMHGRMRDGLLGYDGRLRCGTNRVRHSRGCVLICEADRGDTPLEYHITSGDSGGPLFDRRGRVAGIHSFTQRDPGHPRNTFGEESCHTRVCLYRDWIEATIRENDSEEHP
jgi:hypothetical protein